MFRIFILLILCFSLTGYALDIEIIHPKAGELVNAAAVDSSFILGNVSSADADFYINDQQIPLHDNGAFLAWVPVEPDTFTFLCRAVRDADTTQLAHTVYIPPLWQPPDTLTIEPSFVYPGQFLAVQPGEYIELAFRGTPSCRAFFQIDSLTGLLPMRETTELKMPFWAEIVFGSGQIIDTSPQGGMYKSAFRVPDQWQADSLNIHFYLIDSENDTCQHTLKKRFTVLHQQVPHMAETILEHSVARTDPKKSYYYFLPKGILLNISGQYGSNYRVRLADNIDAWIEGYKIKMLPTGVQPVNQHIDVVREFDAEDRRRIVVYTGRRMPFRVETRHPQQLDVYFYGLTSDVDWIRREFGDQTIREIRWEQIQNDVFALCLSFESDKQWGYYTSYDENDNFVLEIKKPPNVGSLFSTLKGLNVLIDPGHAPDTGATGPIGHTEAEVNLALAKNLAKKLERRGVTVEFTRKDKGVSLYDRMMFANRSNAHVLLSLHHNAIPDGVNPFKNRGTSTYYYHSQSYELARLMQVQLLETLQLEDFGLFWDNLAMCRPASMPAVLLEPAFMMHPESEEMIASKKYQNRCARAIVKALKAYVKN